MHTPTCTCNITPPMTIITQIYTTIISYSHLITHTPHTEDREDLRSGGGHGRVELAHGSTMKLATEIGGSRRREGEGWWSVAEFDEGGRKRAG